MSDPFVGQRYIVTKRVKGQRFRQTVFTNREKRSGDLTVATGTVLTFIGVEKGVLSGRWRFTAEKLAGVEVRIKAPDAKLKLSPLDSAQQASVSDSSSPASPPVLPREPSPARSGFEIGVAEELQRFVALRDSGALTDEEFQAQKARLLTGRADAGQTERPPSPIDGRVDVYLVRTGSQTIQVIKVLRDLTKSGLAEAKATVESAPQRIFEGIPRDEADRAGRLFDETGATIRIQPAGTPFSGQLGSAPIPAGSRKPWYLQPVTYIKLFLAWLLLFGLASCINWLRADVEPAPQQQSQAVQPARPSPAPTPAPAPSAPSGQGLQRILDGLLAGAAELGDFTFMYEETGISLSTAEACLALEQGYRRFDALPGLDGNLGIAMENAKILYFNAQRDCKRGLDRQDVALFIGSVQSADEGFAEIVSLYARLAG
jgi:large subunit ribosomal protein L7/L12